MWPSAGNGPKKIWDDNLSGVRDITLPDGSIVDAAQAKYTVDKNGVYNFSVRDYCGNILSYPVEVSNIDRLAPVADYEVMPGDWTNKPVTIRVTATDPEPEDGYAPSGVKSITMPDGTVVEAVPWISLRTQMENTTSSSRTTAEIRSHCIPR